MLESLGLYTLIEIWQQSNILDGHLFKTSSHFKISPYDVNDLGKPTDMIVLFNGMYCITCF